MDDNNIKVYKNTKIFIVCPANTTTGGPELLHQLAYELRKTLGFNSLMYYFNIKENIDPVPSEYKHYSVPFVKEIPQEEDKKENILILPEVRIWQSILPKYNNIRKGIWFLSLDNFYFNISKKTDFIFQKIINKISENILKKTVFDIYSDKNLKRLMKKYNYKKNKTLKLTNFYLSQSYRAKDHFKNLIPMFYLSDYLNENFLKIVTDLSQKENIVVYNPKKGKIFTEKIIEKSNGKIIFKPIINMTREEVIKTLQKAKVYIDFGNHPGKDRLPREAAILGCCVITGKRGCAAYYEDVPIPDEYKFDDLEKNIPKIIEKIQDCFDNFSERYKDFDYYRKVIKEEPNKFREDMKKIFVLESP